MERRYRNYIMYSCNIEMLTKQDAKMSQGLAILAMVLLHLFCRYDLSMYNVHLFVGTTPLLYYIGLFGDICVPIYCFSSGYAQIALWNKEQGAYNNNRIKRLRSFLCHFWLVVCCFSIVGLVSGSSVIPGSVHAFLGNILLYHLSYNGAWWFVPTYGFLILLSPAFIFAVKRANPLLMIIGSGSIYFVAYILYFNYELTITNKILEWMFEQSLLWGRSQFSFVVGIYFYHCNVIGRIHSIFKNELLRKGIIVILPVMVFVVHCFVQSLIIAPITGIVTLTSFHLWNKPVWIKKIFLFFGRHSTNIWLTHMFFYLILFTGLVYVVREPVAVYLFLLAICIFVSYGIDGIETLLHNGLYRLKITIEGKR